MHFAAKYGLITILKYLLKRGGHMTAANVVSPSELALQGVERLTERPVRITRTRSTRT